MNRRVLVVAMLFVVLTLGVTLDVAASLQTQGVADNPTPTSSSTPLSRDSEHVLAVSTPTPSQPKTIVSLELEDGKALTFDLDKMDFPNIPESEDPGIPWGEYYIKDDLGVGPVQGHPELGNRQRFSLCYPNLSECNVLIVAYCLEENAPAPQVGWKCERIGEQKFSCDHGGVHYQTIRWYGTLRNNWKLWLPFLFKSLPPTSTPTPTPCPFGCPLITLDVTWWDYIGGSFVKQNDVINFREAPGTGTIGRTIRSWTSHPAEIRILYDSQYVGTFTIESLTSHLYGPNGEFKDISPRAQDLSYIISCADIENAIRAWENRITVNVSTPCREHICKSNLYIVDPPEPLTAKLVSQGMSSEAAEIEAERILLKHLDKGLGYEEALRAGFEEVEGLDGSR